MAGLVAAKSLPLPKFSLFPWRFPCPSLVDSFRECLGKSADLQGHCRVWRWIPEESVAYLRALPVFHVLSLPRFRELSMPENRNIAIPRCRKATSGRFGDAPIPDFSDYSPIIQTNATLCGYGQLGQASNSSRRPSTRNEPEIFTHSWNAFHHIPPFSFQAPLPRATIQTLIWYIFYTRNNRRILSILWRGNLRILNKKGHKVGIADKSFAILVETFTNMRTYYVLFESFQLLYVLFWNFVSTVTRHDWHD